MRKIIVGSRKSDLALTQTEHVIKMLKAASEKLGIQVDFEVKKIVTKGDRILDVTLSKVGGKGLFVKEIEQAMYDKEIDIAVHSMKDMPAVLAEGLINAAIPDREDPRDCLISRDNLTLDQLPQGAKVGTSSLRRSSQIKAYRPDLQVEWIRGNINSRIKKLETEGFNAIVLATAGIKRMGWENQISQILSVDVSIPAVGQGALGIQCREDDKEIVDLLGYINHPATDVAVSAERSFLTTLNGGCQVPLGAYATINNLEAFEAGEPANISIIGMVGTPDGTELLKESMHGTDPKALGQQVAEKLIARGADRILKQVRE
jgi:hydroxymethylbilane synthase